MENSRFLVKFYKRYEDGKTRLIFTRKYKAFDEAFLYYTVNKAEFRNKGIFLGFKSC
ncbi:MAG: hypothetical protein ACRDD7_17300 [Peptostreptococcaceae bacterium]